MQSKQLKMATQLLRKDTKSKQNWLRMLKAADKLEFEDGRSMDIEHEIKDRYTIIIH